MRSAAAIVVCVLFAAAGLLKATQPWWSSGQDLITYLLSTGMFSRWSAPWVAWVTIGSELTASVLLLWPSLRTAGWVLVGGLCAAFAVLHVGSLVLGNVEPCNCFGFQFSTIDARWHHGLMLGVCLGMLGLAYAGVCGPVLRRDPAGGVT